MRHLILVLDNEFETLGMVREALTPIGFEVVWVNVAAIMENEWLKKTRFEGIILSFDMRDYPGMTVLQRLHEQGVEIPVIVITSRPNSKQFEKAIRNGVRDYLLKPIDTVELQKKCLRHFNPPSP